MLIHVTARKKLQSIMLSERRQTQKSPIIQPLLNNISRIGKARETESRLVVIEERWGNGEGIT